MRSWLGVSAAGLLLSACALFELLSGEKPVAPPVLDPDLVQAQIEAVLNDFPVAAVKTGALDNTGVIEVVARALTAQPLAGRLQPIGCFAAQPGAVEIGVEDAAGEVLAGRIAQLDQDALQTGE